MKTLKLLVLATVLAITPACKKRQPEGKAPPEPVASGSAPAGSGSDTAGSAAGSDTTGSGSDAGSAAAAGSDSAAAAAEDSIVIYAEHAKKKPDDPVAVKIGTWKVVKANFDPAKIEGGTATIELDLTSIQSNSAKRDAHLATPDYLDVKKFATATVDISNVKPKADKAYTADAKVKLRGVEKKYPVTFEVVDAKDDWIRIKGEHKFARLDFKVGKTGPDESVATDLTVKIALTLKKT